jgi:hypothetical protein
MSMLFRFCDSRLQAVSTALKAPFFSPAGNTAPRMSDSERELKRNASASANANAINTPRTWNRNRSLPQWEKVASG